MKTTLIVLLAASVSSAVVSTQESHQLLRSRALRQAKAKQKLPVTDCPTDYDPLYCASNGNTYTNSCFVEQAGLDPEQCEKLFECPVPSNEIPWPAIHEPALCFYGHDSICEYPNFFVAEVAGFHSDDCVSQEAMCPPGEDKPVMCLGAGVYLNMCLAMQDGNHPTQCQEMCEPIFEPVVCTGANGPPWPFNNLCEATEYGGYSEDECQEMCEPIVEPVVCTGTDGITWRFDNLCEATEYRGYSEDECVPADTHPLIQDSSV